MLIYDLHHKVSPELTSHKWGCGLTITNNYLKDVTQLNTRTEIRPLTRFCHTDFLQTHYRRRNVSTRANAMFLRINL